MTDEQAAAKDWLNRNKGRHDELRAYNLKLEEMRGRASKLVSVPAENKVQTQPNPKHGEQTIIAALEFEEQLKAKLEALEASDMETVKTIEKLPSAKERTVLLYRYVCFKSWEYIARRMRYTVNYCQEIHLAALVHIAPLIDYTIT